MQVQNDTDKKNLLIYKEVINNMSFFLDLMIMLQILHFRQEGDITCKF